MSVRSRAFLPLYTLICFIWGSTWLVIRIGDEASLPPFAGAAARFTIAAAILWIWVVYARIPLPATRREIRASLINGVLGSGTSYAVVYWCSQFIPSGLESVIFGTMPLWTILFGTLVLRTERLTRARAAGVALGLFGIALIFLPDMRSISNSQLSILALLLVAPMVSAVSLLVTKSDGKGIHPVALNAVSITVGAMILSLISLLSENIGAITPNLTQVWTVGYLATFGTVVAFVVYYKLLRSTAAVTMAYVALITPVIAVLLGWLIHGERLDRYAIIGSVAVLVGVWLTTRPAKQREVRLMNEASSA